MGLREKMYRGLTTKTWEGMLRRLGWPPGAAKMMAEALTGVREMPSWGELDIAAKLPGRIVPP